MANYMYISIVLTLAFSPLATWAYSSGAPKVGGSGKETTVCTKLEPTHQGVQALPNPAPYTVEIITNDAKLKDNQVYVGSIKGISAADTLKGFILQARIDGVPAGQFYPGLNSQTIQCSNGNNDTLTHTKIAKPVNQIDFKFHAPASGAEKIVFGATFAKDYAEYWTVRDFSPVLSKN